MEIKLSLDGVMQRYAARIEGLSSNGRASMAMGLNLGGEMVRALTVAAETQQTGLSKRTIAKAQRAAKASASSLVYEIRAGGGDVRLKFFKAKETPKGVSAAPWNRRQVFSGDFIKGGRFPNRVGLSMGGHVFKRAGRKRIPIVSDRSKLFIPTELTRGETAAAFTGGARVAIEQVLAQVAAILP